MLALNRAWITPFTPADWGTWGGAVGQAHVVRFHPADQAYLEETLGIQHWDPLTSVVVLDDTGLTWNGYSPCNGYAYGVRVSLQVDLSDPGDLREFWQTRFTGAPAYMEVMAALPAAVRDLVLACPEQARPHVVAGYLAEQNARAKFPPPAILQASDPRDPDDSRDYVVRGHAYSGELTHRWPETPGPPE